MLMQENWVLIIFKLVQELAIMWMKYLGNWQNVSENIFLEFLIFLILLCRYRCQQE